MALELLNGNIATIDVSLDGTSVKCAFGRWSLQFVRGSTSQLVFCSLNWVAEQPGAVQAVGRLDGFASTGTSFSNPLAFITKATPVAFILTYKAGATLTFDGHVFEDTTEVVASGNAGRSIGFRSTEEVVTAGFTS